IPWHRQLHNYMNLPSGQGQVTLSGPSAEMAAGRLLARINRAGATQRRVCEAVELLESATDPSRFFADAATRTREWGRAQLWGDTGALRFLPPPVRLALEMAAHEDVERAAMEGELAELETAWRDADEVADIADNMLLPDSVVRRWKSLMGSTSPDVEAE